MEKQVNADEFVARFMTGDIDHIKSNPHPVKVFPLYEIAPYIQFPTPPIFLGYNLLVHLTEGYFTHQIGSDQFVVQAPAVLMSNYGNISAIQSIGQRAQGYCVLVKESAMTSLFREQEILNLFTIAPLLNLSVPQSNDLEQLLAQLYRELNTEKPYKALFESLFRTVLLVVIKLSDTTQIKNRRQELAMHFKKLVHQHVKKEKYLPFYADQLGVSINYLNRCVFGTFQKSSKDLILEVLIMHSQLLLLESTKTITNICYELDFTEPSYFSRVFKKIVGVTPLAYRKAGK